MTEQYLVIRVSDKYDVVKIITTYLHTSNAARDLDWLAYPTNWQTGDPIGNGATEQEAIDDLRQDLESRIPSCDHGEMDGQD